MEVIGVVLFDLIVLLECDFELSLFSYLNMLKNNYDF